jgi:hypothetical protein
MCFLTLCISCISFAAPPANDAFAQRVMLSGSSGVVTSDTTGCTLEPGEPYHLFEPYGENSLWWSWTAPSSGSFSFDVVNSAYFTIVVVYEGDSLTNLSRTLYSASSYYNIDAVGGSSYQIAVVNRYPGDEGQVILRYYQESFSPWFVSSSSTGGMGWIGRTLNGNIMYGHETHVNTEMSRSNRFGIIGQDYTVKKNIQQPMTVIDKDNTILVNNEHPPGLSPHYWLPAYKGEKLVIHDQDRKMLALYEIGKGGFTLKGESPTEFPRRVSFDGSLIMANQFKDQDALYVTHNEFTAFNKSLKKIKWGEPLALGNIIGAFKNGVTCRSKPDPYMMTFEFGKRGKKYYTRKLPYSLASRYYVLPDSKGGLLYWWFTGSDFSCTNTPLSYIKKNGKFLFENQELPDAGSVWKYGCYNGKYFYIVTYDGVSYTVTGYKLGKKITKLRSLSMSDFSSINFYGKMLTVNTRQEGTIVKNGFMQYDAKMKKLAWEEPLAEGSLFYLGDGVFSREWLQVDGSQTNYIIKIFNQKGTIAEHSIAQ